MEETQETRPAVSVHRLECSVDWPPGNVAAYLVDCAEPVLIDTGMTGESAREEIAADLSAVGYDFGDVEHLVVTHPHVDHVGQVPALLDANDPTVYAPAGVRERFQRDPDALEATVRENARAAGLRGEYLDQAIEMSVESLERDSRLLPPESVDYWIEPGEDLDVGPLTFETVHTPGHQADHICFRTDLDGESVLFSGDMALATFRPVTMHTGFDDGYEDAIDAFYTALSRLERLSVDRVFPGHDAVHTEFQESVADSRSSLDRLLDRTREALAADDRKTAVDIAFQRSGDKDIRYLVIETYCALAKLERDGDVTGEADDDGARQYTLA